MRKLSMQKITRIEKELKKFELFNSKLERAAKSFFESMVKTNKHLVTEDIRCVAYSRVFHILKDTTAVFAKNDFTCFYNEHIINAIIKECVGTEKLADMHMHAVAIRDVVMEAYASRNKMREMAEEYEGTDELLDAIELIVLNRNMALKKAYKEIVKLKQNVAKENMVA